MELDQISPAIWRALDAAKTMPEHPFRTLSLGSNGLDGAPQLRLLVLRAVDPQLREVELHTDLRSPKWAELQADPRATLLGYDAQTCQQIRLTAQAQVFGPGHPRQAAAWGALRLWTRTTYCGGPPGDALSAPVAPFADGQRPSEADTAPGAARFGVIALRVQSIDWFQHGRNALRRARILYRGDGAVSGVHWITP